VDAGAQRTQPPSRGLANAVEAEDPADRSLHAVMLRQPLQQGERHGHGVLGHRLSVGAEVAGDRGLTGELVEEEMVGARRQQLDKPGRQIPGLVGP